MTKTCERGHTYTDARQCPSCARAWRRHFQRSLPPPSERGPWNMPLLPHTLDVLRWETFKAEIVHRIEMERFLDRVAERGRAS
jgi:hypothetical protein